MSYPQHELSKKFPSMPADEFQALVADIKEHGLRNNIILHDGKVLDGWHRYNGCLAAKINPTFTKYTGKSPAAFVLSNNLHRRHLTPSQRGLIVVECHEWLPAHRRSTAQAGVKSSAEMAVEADTSEDTITRAKTVAANGSEALKKSVREGSVTVKAAAEVAKTTPKGKQAKAVKERATKAKPAKGATVPKADYDRLAAEYADLKENRDELAAELEACGIERTDERVIKIKQLHQQIRSIELARDDAMNKARDMAKQLNYWKNQAEKLGWKPAKNLRSATTN